MGVLRNNKDSDGNPFSEVVIHKLTYFPCLLSMYLSICYTHFELRLGIISSTELPVTLWFIDIMMMQFREMEQNYVKCRCGDSL